MGNGFESLSLSVFEEEKGGISEILLLPSLLEKGKGYLRPSP